VSLWARLMPSGSASVYLAGMIWAAPVGDLKWRAPSGRMRVQLSTFRRQTEREGFEVPTDVTTRTGFRDRHTWSTNRAICRDLTIGNSCVGTLVGKSVRGRAVLCVRSVQSVGNSP
jgi:hypothetical protein